jgi:hypothetical protein
LKGVGRRATDRRRIPTGGTPGVLCGTDRRIAAGDVDIEDALRALQQREVVDAAGYTWRIDLMTQGFIRKAPGESSAWRSTHPEEFVAKPGPEAADENASSAPADKAPRTPGRARGLGVAVTGALVVVTAAMGLITPLVDGDDASANNHASEPSAGTTHLSSPSIPARVLSGPLQVPSPDRYSAVLAEITSSNVDRIAAVTKKSQFGGKSRRLHAATYAGWANEGLILAPGTPIGTPSGTTATQVWELRDGTMVLAVANVAWHRADPMSSWLLTQWPEFHPVG